MTDVFINSKLHKSIERLSVKQLEHLAQLAQVEIDNYISYSRSSKCRKYELHILSLNKRKACIDRVLINKQKINHE